TSFETGPVPQAFFPRRRTKYVPRGAAAVSVVAALPRSRLAIFDAPGADPASTRYVVGDPGAAVHRSTMLLVRLLTIVRPLGAPGAAEHAAGPTTSVTSGEAAPTPLAFFALTRMKYVPF